MTGRIKKLIHVRGYGFVKGEDGKDYFLLYNQVYDTPWVDLKEGEVVHFDVGEDPKGPTAINVRRRNNEAAV